jgi:hypothetical protein
MMRRSFITFVEGAAAWPLVARAAGRADAARRRVSLRSDAILSMGHGRDRFRRP